MADEIFNSLVCGELEIGESTRLSSLEEPEIFYSSQRITWDPEKYKKSQDFIHGIGVLNTSKFPHFSRKNWT